MEKAEFFAVTLAAHYPNIQDPQMSVRGFAWAGEERTAVICTGLCTMLCIGGQHSVGDGDRGAEDVEQHQADPLALQCRHMGDETADVLCCKSVASAAR
jgi:hypothetical protein